MMVTQAGTGSGTSGPSVRKIWEALYGVHGTEVDTAKAALPGASPPTRCRPSSATARSCRPGPADEATR